MLKTGLSCVLLAAVLLLESATRLCAGTTGSISGKVRDQSGNGITGANVTAASPSQTLSVRTNSSGFYAILNLSPDTYAVTASKDGYESATTFGVTVNADQSTGTDMILRPAIKTIGHVRTTAVASIVSKTITGDLYSVDARAIEKYNGAVGGAETLFSQGSVVGSLPGVVRAIGAGPGYQSVGTLSLRGGAYDQVGYELDGVPLNRGFDYANGTAFTTNGIASLQVYTGGAPADEGRAMSGFINEIISRGRYPGGADFTAVVGAPLYDHSVLAHIYGGTPDQRFTYFISTLATNNYVNFGDRSNLANTSFTVPANDPNCGAFNNVLVVTGLPLLNCNQSYVLNQPVSAGAYASTPFNAGRDTAANLHWNLVRGGLTDDIQVLYITGTTSSAPWGMYGTAHADPAQASNNYSGDGVGPNGTLTWPTGVFYRGRVGQPYDPALLLTLAWPTSGNSVHGIIPASFQDSEAVEYSVEKLAYTRAITQSSFVRLTGYKMYSFWGLDQPINGLVGGVFYQLHDNMTGLGFNYQDQLSEHHLFKLFADWNRDPTLRSAYNDFISSGVVVSCVTGGVAQSPCTTPKATVTSVGAPSNPWSTVTPLDWDGVFSDNWKVNEKLLFDVGLRWDQFGFQLMPLAINGLNGIAYLGEEVDGQCLHGFAYNPNDPEVIGPFGNQNCSQLLPKTGKDAPGAFNWQDAGGSLDYTYTSPRFGATLTLGSSDVIRLSVGRYVQPPNSAHEQYRTNPLFGPGGTVLLLNRFYDSLGLNNVHNILPEDSTNYDLSMEHQFRGGYSVKLTPYYRNTRNQVLAIPVNPRSPLVTGDNLGIQRISGFELLAIKNVDGENGIGGTLALTETDSKIRFTQRRGGGSYVDFINGVNASGQCQGFGICGYNQAYNTHYPLVDPNGYYSPSQVLAPNLTWPSHDVKWVLNLTIDAKVRGFEIIPTFNYQSASPYGDPLNFPDAHCIAPGPPPSGRGCTQLPSGTNPNTGLPYAFYGGYGPDPYTNKFDSLGSLEGPSWWIVSLAISQKIGPNTKATILGTNVLTGVYNHGYPWEQPNSQNNIAYSDNGFYLSAPLGAFASTLPSPPTAYYGNNYYPYASFAILPYRDWIFSVSTEL